MAKTRIVLNKSGVREMLRSNEMMNICLEHANATMEAAGGEGYEVTSYTGKNRVNASVRANTVKTIKDNLENNTLLKSLR